MLLGKEYTKAMTGYVAARRLKIDGLATGYRGVVHESHCTMLLLGT
jgi:hypothetical protein